jgi:mono/diheme cytochrome c family protein
MHHVLLLALAAGVAVSGCKKKEEAPTPVGVTPIPGPGALGMPGMPREQLIAAGKPVFVANCAKCHGENGKGVAAGAPNFTDPAWQAEQKDPDLMAVIQKGREGLMPAFGSKLKPAELQAVLAYVRAFGSAPQPGGPPIPGPGSQ